MNYYKEIRNELINNEINRKVKNYSINKSDLTTYYNVGKLLSDAGKHYGEGVIKEYSKKLTNELGKGYNITALKRMRRFYLLNKKGATVSHQLSWSHYCEVMWFDENKMNYYIEVSIDQNLSVRELRNRIKSKEYERLDENTRKKIINKEDLNIKDKVKNPIIIRNINNYEIITEKLLKKLILEDIDGFLKELGSGFSYIANEYKIKIGDRYNYIDLLLYNYIFKCFVVIELKITKVKSRIYRTNNKIYELC